MTDPLADIKEPLEAARRLADRVCLDARHTHEMPDDQAEVLTDLIKAADGAVERLGQAEAALRGFEKYGIRADLNPTRQFADTTQAAHDARVDEYAWWCGYISRADKQVREIARKALAVVSPDREDPAKMEEE